MGTKLLFGKTAGANSRREETKKAQDFMHPFFNKSALLSISDIVTLVTLKGWGSTFLNGPEFPYRSSTGLGR